MGLWVSDWTREGNLAAKCGPWLRAPPFQRAAQGIIAVEWTHLWWGWEMGITATTDRDVGWTRVGCFCWVRAHLPQGAVCASCLLLTPLKSLVQSLLLPLSSRWCLHVRWCYHLCSCSLLLLSLTMSFVSSSNLMLCSSGSGCRLWQQLCPSERGRTGYCILETAVPVGVPCLEGSRVGGVLRI